MNGMYVQRRNKSKIITTCKTCDRKTNIKHITLHSPPYVDCHLIIYLDYFAFVQYAQHSVARQETNL